jgi:hypothetical protein
MSYVIAAPEMMTSAASDLATIGSNVNAAHMAAAARTTAVLPAAPDGVSTGIAQLFSQHAANYQALAAQAAAFNNQFVQNLTAGAGAYINIEATIESFLQNYFGFLGFLNPFFWYGLYQQFINQFIKNLECPFGMDPEIPGCAGM